jgi:geranylgeranyl reductase
MAAAVKDGQVIPEGRKLRVAVIGGGPSGACAAETLAKGGVEAFLIERKMDNCKVCYVCQICASLMAGRKTVFGL